MATKNFFEKGGSIELPPIGAKAQAVADGAGVAKPIEQSGVEDRPRRPRTAAGSMASFMEREAGASLELAALKDKFDGASPTRYLDPSSIAVSRWANRHAASFMTAEFAAFKDEIASAGGNVQAILVRKIDGAQSKDGELSPGKVSRHDDSGAANEELSPGKTSAPQYEVVYGHRRHRACLELGLPLLCQIEEEIDDKKLFVLMDRENRERADLSAWEQGMMFSRALSEGLFNSARSLASALGVTEGTVSRSLSLAMLPDTVVNAFASPLDLQFRFAAALNKALQVDPEGVVDRAKKVASQQKTGKPIAAKAVMGILTQESGQGGPRHREVSVQGRVVASWKADRKGRITVAFTSALMPGQEDVLAKAIAKLEFSRGLD